MSVQEKIKRITQTCKINGVALSGKLANVGVTGYASDGCQLFAEGCVDTMEEYCRYGVNHGFAGVADAIEALSKLAVSMTDKKADKKLAKAEESKRRIEAEVKLTHKGDTMEIKEQVYKYIDTSAEACDVVAGLDIAKSRAGILKKSKAKLAELRSIVEDALDGSTEKAAECAGKVIYQVRLWRRDTANSMHSEASLVYLDKAIEEAKAWSKLSESVKSGGLFARDKRAKEDKIVKYVPDAVSRIADSVRVKNNIEIFHENLEAYKRTAEERYGTASRQEKKKEYQAQIDALEQEKKQITAAQRNGEMDLEEALVRCRDEIDPELRDLREEVAAITSEITQRNAMRREYDYVYRKLETINDFIMSYRNDPGMLVTLGMSMDFNKLNNVMRGLASSDEINHVIDLEMANKLTSAQAREAVAALRESISEAGKEFRATHGNKQGTGVRTQAEEEERRAQIKREADEYFKNEASKEEESAKESQTATEKVKYVAFSDEDK